jgi:hypothetical protein
LAGTRHGTSGPDDSFDPNLFFKRAGNRADERSSRAGIPSVESVDAEVS